MSVQICKECGGFIVEIPVLNNFGKITTYKVACESCGRTIRTINRVIEEV